MAQHHSTGAAPPKTADNGRVARPLDVSQGLAEADRLNPTTLGSRLKSMTNVFFDPSFNWRAHPLWRQVWDAVDRSESLETSGYDPGATGSRDEVLTALLAGNESARGKVMSDTLAELMMDDQTFMRMKQTAITMFRRENTHGQIREVDSEIIFLRLVLSWQRVLQESNPRLVIFAVTPHFVDSFSLLAAAQALGIRTLWFQPSSLTPVMMPRFSLAELPDSRTLAGPCEDTTSTILRILELQLSGAQARAPKTYLARQAALDESAGRVGGKWRAILWTVRWLIRGRFPDRIFPPRAYQLPRPLDRVLQVLVPRISAISLRKAFFREVSEEAPGGNYALFALHYEPERTSVPEGGVESSQVEQIIKANSLVSEDMGLVVREHRSQLSAAMAGYRGRSPFFYELAVRDLGLTLDYATPLPTIIDNATVVFTGSGNIAVEAAMAGVPVVYFGFPWWAGMPGTYSYGDVIQQGLKVRSLVGSDPETVANFVETRCLSEMLPGGASESLEELERRFGPLGCPFMETSGKAVADFVINEVLSSR